MCCLLKDTFIFRGFNWKVLCILYLSGQLYLLYFNNFFMMGDSLCFFVFYWTSIYRYRLHKHYPFWVFVEFTRSHPFTHLLDTM